MKRINDIAYFLTIDEIRVLLQRYEVQGIQLFSEIAEARFDEISAASGLMGLIKDGILLPQGEGYSLSDDWISICEVLSASRFTIKETGGEIPDRLLFFNKKRAVSLQIDDRRTEKIRIKQDELEAAIDGVIDLLGVEVPQEQSGRIFNEYVDKGLSDLKNDERVLLTLERFPRGEETADVTIMLYHDDLQEVLLFYDKEGFKGVTLYSEETVRNIYKELYRDGFWENETILNIGSRI